MVDHKLTEVKYINYEKINEEWEGLKQISANLKTRSIGDKVGYLAALLGINGAVAYLIAWTCTATCAAERAVCTACIGEISL